MGIFWFRVHNWWAQKLEEAYKNHSVSEEFLFNRARQFTIATYQVKHEIMVPTFILFYKMSMISWFFCLLFQIDVLCIYTCSMSPTLNGYHCFWRTSLEISMTNYHHTMLIQATVLTLSHRLAIILPLILRLHTSISQLL